MREFVNLSRIRPEYRIKADIEQIDNSSVSWTYITEKDDEQLAWVLRDVVDGSTERGTIECVSVPSLRNQATINLNLAELYSQNLR